ncbi:MAG: hypothetical protein RL641_826 [Candidatus Parcubacteria bacterium]|jgi:hypothetical protein
MAKAPKTTKPKDIIDCVRNLNTCKISMSLKDDNASPQKKAMTEFTIIHFRLLAQKSIAEEGFTIIEKYPFIQNEGIEHSLALGYSHTGFKTFNFKVAVIVSSSSSTNEGARRRFSSIKIFETIYGLNYWLKKKDGLKLKKVTAVNKIRNQAILHAESLMSSPEHFFKSINIPSKIEVDMNVEIEENQTQLQFA